MTPRPPKMHEPLEYDFREVLTGIADENMPTIQGATARPFLKWVGGKRLLVTELTKRLPDKYETYCEPMIGGAALYFSLKPSPAYLSDVNFPLVLTYRAVRDDIERLISNLAILKSKHTKEHYLKARLKIASETDPTKIGALFIYLNKTCYNGLYRVNQKGAFNVPMGSYTDPAILDEENLRAASKALQDTELWLHDFSQVPIRKANFYYLDPPYHKTYSNYDGAGFGDDDHKALSDFCKRLHQAGAYFMVSNSDTPYIRALYKDFTIEQVEGSRFVSCKGNQRGKETELLIRNYQREQGEQHREPTRKVHRECQKIYVRSTKKTRSKNEEQTLA